MKKYSVNLLRIFFRNSNFTLEEENNLHYLYNQISLLLIVELSNVYHKKTDSLIISFGTKELWLKHYTEESIPNYHWYKRTGSASIIFDYERFNKLEYEDRKKMVFNLSCESIYKIAEKGHQSELMQSVDQIMTKYRKVSVLNTEYVAFQQSLEYYGKIILVKVLFEFDEKIKISLVVSQSDLSETKYLLDEINYGYIEWLITAFKKIEIKNKSMYLKGSKELEYLPYKINLD
jgi:hypothetical protein